MASTVKAVQMQMATVLTDWKPTQGKRFGEFSEGLSGFTKKAWRVSRETCKNLGDPICSCDSVHWQCPPHEKQVGNPKRQVGTPMTIGGQISP